MFTTHNVRFVKWGENFHDTNQGNRERDFRFS